MLICLAMFADAAYTPGIRVRSKESKEADRADRPHKSIVLSREA